MGRLRRSLFLWPPAAAWVLLGWTSMGALAQTPITFCASWVINSQRAHVIVAIEKGYFKTEGLDVNFVRGSGSGDTFRRVGIGNCLFGEATAGAAVLGRANNIRAKLIAMQSHKLEETLFFFADSGIQSPKDLEGKRITGGPKQSSNVLMFPIFGRLNGIDLSKVQMVYMNPASVIPSQGAGAVDASIGFYRARAAYEKAARQAGKQLRWIRYADAGMDLYQDGVTASDETIANQGDLIVRFLRGLFRGIVFTLQNPEEAVDIYMKRYPGESREFSLQTVRLTQESLFDKHYDKDGYGHMNREKMANTLRVTLEAHGKQPGLTLQDVMTNQFIDRLPRELRFPRR